MMESSNVLVLGEAALADCRFRVGTYLAETSEREITSVLSAGHPGPALSSQLAIVVCMV
jgi:hypothetical protein